VGEMIPADELLGKYKGVRSVPYNGETLYNILMAQHDVIIVNNLVCETLHPDNAYARMCVDTGSIIYEKVDYIKMSKQIKLNEKYIRIGSRVYKII